MVQQSGGLLVHQAIHGLIARIDCHLEFMLHPWCIAIAFLLRFDCFLHGVIVHKATNGELACTNGELACQFEATNLRPLAPGFVSLCCCVDTCAL